MGQIGVDMSERLRFVSARLQISTLDRRDTDVRL